MPFVNKLPKDVVQVIDSYNSARDAKESLGIIENWRTYEDYCRNKQNEPLEEDDPGSVTNVTFPIIASQVADLVDEPVDITCIGEEPADEVFSKDVGHLLDWISFQNKLFFKLDRFEWRRLKFGSSVWKVYFDPVTEMILIEPVSPVNFFPDPKIKEPWHLQEADFVDHVLNQPINYLKRVYGSAANSLQSMRNDDLSIFEGETNEEVRALTANKARVIEHWSIESKGVLRRRVVANETLLYDSKDTHPTFYDHGRYPFSFVQCYPLEGRLWGMGDVELLKPTQDLINDLDDQIRTNARQMGNIQIVVGLASGINIRKWTKKAGLRIPARDPNAWQMVQPPPMPEYIQARRIQGMNEAEIISGRPDVTEGRRSGVRAASAIMALQEAGNRRARHKKLSLQEGLGDVFNFCIDYLKQFYTEEKAFRILGKANNPNLSMPNQPPEYMWFRGSSLKQIPMLVPNGKGELIPLMGNGGKVSTKDAKFDLRVSIGAGLPHNQAFLYQSLLDMKREGILTAEEARMFIKDTLDWPVANPMEPIGTNFGMGINGQQQPSQGNLLNPNQAADVAGGINPQIMNQIIATLGGGGA
jgi:hypothetical protein